MFSTYTYFYSNLYGPGPRGDKKSDIIKPLSSCTKIEPELRKLQKQSKLKNNHQKNVFL